MNASRRARDEWLALRCQALEQGAFEALIAELERPLFYYAAKLTGSQDTALDVLQEVWIRAFRGIRALKDPASVRAWLYTMVHGIVVDEIRRDRTRQRAEQIHADMEDDSSEPRFTALDAAAVHQSLDRLELRHRELLVLYFIEDFSITEMSQILSVPEGTVKSRVHYAKRALKAAMKGTNGN
jgi:RNA polymerase sigma-70 factor, ECF subfamily